MAEAVARAVRSAKVGRLAIEADSMSVALRERLAAKLVKLEMLSTSGLVEHFRQVKEKQEIELIREAIRCAERGLGVVRAILQPRQTEKQVADELAHQMRLFGGQREAFPSIVASGPRAALPHAVPTDRRLGEDSFLLVDWGARAGLYHSDLTRVLVTGRISPKFQRIYGVVLEAQARAIAAIRPGATAEQVDGAARAVIAKAGFGRYFGHGLGHGLGLSVHESPRMAARNSAELRAGMVVTVEPGIYLPGWGGVRIEDDVLVTRDGCEVLSSAPKQLEDVIVG
jgi:Xaa-Pro aminopeptidase